MPFALHPNCNYLHYKNWYQLLYYFMYQGEISSILELKSISNSTLNSGTDVIFASISLAIIYFVIDFINFLRINLC